MKLEKLRGLIVATYTPLRADGGLYLDIVPAMVEYLLSQPISGLYICGSTGEGMSLTSDERIRVSEAYIQAVAGRVPVIVQVGHNSDNEARKLSEEAYAMGATAISATCPSYYKVGDAKS